MKNTDDDVQNVDSREDDGSDLYQLNCTISFIITFHRNRTRRS